MKKLEPEDLPVLYTGNSTNDGGVFCSWLEAQQELPNLLTHYVERFIYGVFTGERPINDRIKGNAGRKDK